MDILILDDFVVHKKDVLAESSLAHAASWGPPLLFRFQSLCLGDSETTALHIGMSVIIVF